METIKTESNSTVQIMKHPDNAVIYAIAKHYGDIADKVVRGLNRIISEAHKHSDYFATVMMQDDEVVGYASFIQSRTETHTWLYTDLWVSPQHCRQGYATEMVKAGIQHLSTLGAKRVLCSVDPDNNASLSCHLMIFNTAHTPNNTVTLPPPTSAFIS